MTKVMQFNSFKTSYHELNKNLSSRFLIEYYHHAHPGEPVISILDNVYEVVTTEIEGDTHITIKTFSETSDISFTSGEYETNLSNGYVVFASKHDNETHCLISFPDESKI